MIDPKRKPVPPSLWPENPLILHPKDNPQALFYQRAGPSNLWFRGYIGTLSF
jgi:hypothetical protein